ncbi:MAG: hypothetical protein KAG66_02000 [Methylococcales bacterium]|nr:hypothetical protein [Methylococcales bacterium]
MYSRVDFKRYNNGCKKLRNAVCKTQGPATRRPGLEFINSLTLITDRDADNDNVRLVPFIFNEIQSYVLVFYEKTNGDTGVVVATDDDFLFEFGQPLKVTGTFPAADPFLKEFDYAQSADEMYIAQSGQSPLRITRTSHISWALDTVPFVDAPGDWTATNFPERITLHQQRLVFAASRIRRQTVWMSKAGSFFDFGSSVPVVDSDAVSFTLDSGTQNKIVWLLSGKALNIGTIGNEWVVTGATRNALTPTNILAQRQTNLGSEPIKPLLVGITALFVERFGRSINEFVYEFATDSYNTSDMSIISKHVTDFFSIKEWAFQQTPDKIIWSVRSDGALLGTTYERQHEVIGWHVHDTDGEFKSITSIPGNSREDQIWFLVKRTRPGGGGDVIEVFLERFADEFLNTDTAVNARFLDSYIVKGGTTESVVGGLGHLSGKTVGVLADGAVHPPVVVSAGQIALNGDYTDVVVGLPYISEIWPTLSHVTREDGTSLGRKQKTVGLSIDFYATLGAFVGTWRLEDGEHVEEQPFRVPGDLTFQPLPLYSGMYHMNFPEGFDREVNYFIRQDSPLPLTVRSVTDEVQVFE